MQTSTLPYWSDYVRSPSSGGGSAARKLTADVTVIGAGITGLLTSYWLIRSAPALRIVVLEAGKVGQGASGRNAGMILPRPCAHIEKRFGSEAVQFTYDHIARAPQTIEALATTEGFSCDLQRAPFLSVALTDRQVEELDRIAQTYRRFNMPCSVLDQQATAAALAGTGFRASLEQPGAASLNPGKLLDALYRVLLASGVQIFESSPVLSIEHDRACKVTTPQNTIFSDWSIVATAISSTCSGYLRPRFRPVEQQSFVVLTEPVPAQLRELGWDRHQCVSDLRRISNYARRCGDRVLFGGRMGFHGPGCSGDTTSRIFARLGTELVRWFPALRNATITHQWQGTLDISPLRIPVIDRVGPDGRVVHVYGYSGLGIAASTVCSRAAADIVLGNEEQWARLVYRLSAQGTWAAPVSARKLAYRFAAAYEKLLDSADEC